MTLGAMIGIMWASLVVVIPLSCWMLRKATGDVGGIDHHNEE